MTNHRKVCYITGTRADFGLMESTLKEIDSHPFLELEIIVTGTHFSEYYGSTINDIEKSGLPVSAKVELSNIEEPSGVLMAKNIGYMLQGLVDKLLDIQPDIVLLLGDRGEMLAAALAAIHLNIPVAHIHGGERSGTIDEPVRHAISKLVHLHFVATQESLERLIKMGEKPDCIWVTGAPGLDGLNELACLSRETLFDQVGFDLRKKCALLVYHPVLQDTLSLESDTETILESLQSEDLQILALLPNSDAGSEHIRKVLVEESSLKGVHVVSHLSRNQFISWMAISDVMIGNSSSGIIEAATFGTPVINIGSRQNLRERNVNVMDVMPEPIQIKTALKAALKNGKFAPENIYGDGHAAKRIVDILSEYILPEDLLFKVNAY